MGGAIYSNNTLNVTNCTFTSNKAHYGGAIYQYLSNGLTITDSNFTGNTATINGGAIFNTGSSTANINNTTFTSNTAQKGGAIYNYSNSTANIHFSRIIQNSGYDIYNLNSSLNADNNWWGSNSDPSGRIHGATVSKMVGFECECE